MFEFGIQFVVWILMYWIFRSVHIEDEDLRVRHSVKACCSTVVHRYHVMGMKVETELQRLAVYALSSVCVWVCAFMHACMCVYGLCKEALWNLSCIVYCILCMWLVCFQPAPTAAGAGAPAPVIPAPIPRPSELFYNKLNPLLRDKVLHLVQCYIKHLYLL